MARIEAVEYTTQMTENGADIPVPADALQALGLPTEHEEIRNGEVFVNLTVFRTKDDQHLGTRDRLLYPARKVYWARKGEERHPSENVRIYLRRGEKR